MKHKAENETFQIYIVVIYSAIIRRKTSFYSICTHNQFLFWFSP